MVAHVSTLSHMKWEEQPAVCTPGRAPRFPGPAAVPTVMQRPTTTATPSFLSPFPASGDDFSRWAASTGEAASRIEALLLESVAAPEDGRRAAAVQWALKLFDFAHVPARYICVLGGGDGGCLFFSALCLFVSAAFASASGQRNVKGCAPVWNMLSDAECRGSMTPRARFCRRMRAIGCGALGTRHPVSLCVSSARSALEVFI